VLKARQQPQGAAQPRVQTTSLIQPGIKAIQYHLSQLQSVIFVKKFKILVVELTIERTFLLWLSSRVRAIIRLVEDSFSTFVVLLP